MCVCSEKVHRVHQLSSPVGDEEWKIRPGLQTVPEDDPPGKSQVGHPGQQLPSSEVYKYNQSFHLLNEEVGKLL